MRLFLLNFIYLPTLVFLSACTVGPDFIESAPPSVSDYAAENDLKQFGEQYINEDKIISSHWWQEFSSPALNEVIAYGLKNNLSLDSAKRTLAQSRELVNAAQGQLWPQAAMNAGAGRQKYGVALFGPADFTIPPFTYYEVGPSVSYLLDIFGGTRRTIEKQQAVADYQLQILNAAYLSLTGNIVNTALTIATINAQIDTLKEIIIEDKENLRLVQHAFDLGAATKGEVLSAQSQLTNDEALLPDLYQQRKIAQNALNVLVSRTPTEWRPPYFELENFKLPEELPLTLPSELVRTRPDILAAEAMLHAASADVGIATANLYPSITLTGSLFQEALTPRELFNASSSAWSYFANVSAPIFNGGTLRAQQQAAVHAYESAFSAYQQVVVNSFVQVNDVLHALKYDENAEELQKQAVLTAKKSLELTRLSFKEGGANILELLNAKRFYMQSRFGYIKAQGQRYQDTVQLYLVLGGRSHLPDTSMESGLGKE